MVYISPSVELLGGNVSGMIGFEPNSNGIKEGYASVNSINGANANSVQGGSSSRRRNTVDFSATYENEYDGFANKFSAAYLHASPLGSTGGVYSYNKSGNLTVPTTNYGNSAPNGYSEMGVYQFGAQTTYAGFTVGGNIKGGQVNGGYDFKAKGARNAFGYIVGAVYNYGPYTLGAHYFNEQSAGNYVPGSTNYARTLSEYGVAVGGDYELAKPITLYVQYGYGHLHQPTSVSTAQTNSQVQFISTGAFMSW